MSYYAAVRQRLATLADGSTSITVYLDSGSEITGSATQEDGVVIVETAADLTTTVPLDQVVAVGQA
ncbi:MAG: hypothetical protein GEV09_15560 [Pseudonocardiaceae bacterium]|nr:hypothetical protein [Pseudonocardiaceae bacterium]